jgi:cytochrome c oxidase cbb3-type subunit 4
MSMDANTVETGAMIGMTVDMGVVRGLITVLTMAVFFGITWWAYHRGNRKRFDADAMLPFSDDEQMVIAVESAADEPGEGEQ